MNISDLILEIFGADNLIVSIDNLDQLERLSFLVALEMQFDINIDEESWDKCELIQDIVDLVELLINNKKSFRF